MATLAYELRTANQIGNGRPVIMSYPASLVPTMSSRFLHSVETRIQKEASPTLFTFLSITLLPHTPLNPRLPSTQDFPQPKTSLNPRLPSTQDFARTKTSLNPRLPSTQDFPQPKTSLNPRLPSTQDFAQPKTSLNLRLRSNTIG